HTAQLVGGYLDEDEAVTCTGCVSAQSHTKIEWSRPLLLCSHCQKSRCRGARIHIFCRSCRNFEAKPITCHDNRTSGSESSWGVCGALMAGTLDWPGATSLPAVWIMASVSVRWSEQIWGREP